MRNLDPAFYTRNLVDPRTLADLLGIRIETIEIEPGGQRSSPPLFWSDPLVVVERQDLENDTNLLIWYGVIKIMMKREGIDRDLEREPELLEKLLNGFALGKPSLRVIDGGLS